jgi:hypothetical protein
MLNLSLIVLQLVFPLCDYKVWIDTERGEEAKNHLRRMVELKRSGRRRGHESVRKHDVRRKRMSEVVRKR